MFARFAHAIVHHPWRVIAAWIVAVIAIVAVSPKLADVTNSDQTSFLPSSYESVQALALAKRVFPIQADASATFVFKRADDAVLSAGDGAAIRTTTVRLQALHIPRVRAVITDGRLLAPNHRLLLAQVAFAGSPTDKPMVAAVGTLRQHAAALLRGTGLRAGLTGQVAFAVDSTNAYAQADAVIGLATVLLIVVLLGTIFRSPIAALLPIVAVGLVYTTATALVALVAKTFHFQVADNLTSLLIVVLFGVGTDYIVFLLFRYRERLQSGLAPREALAQALARVGEVIASSALAVIVAFGALYLSRLGDLRAMAPGLMIAVAAMLLGGLTLVPAIIALLGPRVFWPSRRWQRAGGSRLAARLGDLVAHRPGRVALLSGGTLALLAVGSLFYHANYDVTSSLPQHQESTTAYHDLTSAFPAGALNPTQVFVTSPTSLGEQQLATLSGALLHTKGVAAVLPPQLGMGGRAAELDLYLTANPYSDAALNAVGGPIRDTAHHALPGARVLVGGMTSAYVDVRAAINRDLAVIFPVAGLLIALILVVLLRSLVAPLYLLGAVALGYAATLGASVGLFQGLGCAGGLDFTLPIVLYLFVVAIGTDYNILTTARLREEFDAGHEGREAARRAVTHGGPTVAAAGVILAGTFASMMLSGISSMVEMGFAVAIGIALAAFVMAAALVPSIAAVLGRRIWWPGQLAGRVQTEQPHAAWMPAPVEAAERLAS